MLCCWGAVPGVRVWLRVPCGPHLYNLEFLRSPVAAQHLPGCSSAVGMVSSALVLSEQARNRGLALAAAVRVSNWKMRGKSASLWHAEVVQKSCRGDAEAVQKWRRGRTEVAQKWCRSQPCVRWLLMCVENGPTLW